MRANLTPLLPIRSYFYVSVGITREDGSLNCRSLLINSRIVHLGIKSLLLLLSLFLYTISFSLFLEIQRFISSFGACVAISQPARIYYIYALVHWLAEEETRLEFVFSFRTAEFAYVIHASSIE